MGFSIHFLLKFLSHFRPFLEHSNKKIGNSLVYGIDVAGFSVYLLNYQHCWKCVLKIQHRCAGISAQRTIPTPRQPPQSDYFDISILEYQKEILKMKLCCHIGLRFFHQIIRFLASQVRIMWFAIRLLTLTLQCILGAHTDQLPVNPLGIPPCEGGAADGSTSSEPYSGCGLELSWR